MRREDLINTYRELLEQDIVTELHRRLGCSYEKAIDLYYTSELANSIYYNKYNTPYLDYSLLVDELIKELALS